MVEIVFEFASKKMFTVTGSLTGRLREPDSFPVLLQGVDALFVN